MIIALNDLVWSLVISSLTRRRIKYNRRRRKVPRHLVVEEYDVNARNTSKEAGLVRLRR